LAYRIRNGKICEPLKGASLIGKGLEVIQAISMIGNDLLIEKSAGVCGKGGQNVVVGCGQPTLKVANMTIGGRDKGPS
jgi:TldD protein